MIQPFTRWIKSLLEKVPCICLQALGTLGLPLSAAGAAEKVAVFPESTYDGYIIYQNLAIFWLFIIGLIVIIRMKLKEIERTQKLGLDADDENAPRLD
jgi:hypothetical protein